MGSYTIIKAQAYAYSDSLDHGIDLAIQGVRLAQAYGSMRHVSRVQVLYDRLRTTKRGTHPRVRDLQEALASTP